MQKKVRVLRTFSCCERHLMKTSTKPASGRKGDSLLDETLNLVELSSNEIAAAGLAFPRPGFATRPRTPSWRTDGTIGTVLGMAGRMPARASRP
jgi:hypothetical protein